MMNSSNMANSSGDQKAFLLSALRGVLEVQQTSSSPIPPGLVDRLRPVVANPPADPSLRHQQPVASLLASSIPPIPPRTLGGAPSQAALQGLGLPYGGCSARGSSSASGAGSAMPLLALARGGSSGHLPHGFEGKAPSPTSPSKLSPQVEVSLLDQAIANEKFQILQRIKLRQLQQQQQKASSPAGSTGDLSKPSLSPVHGLHQVMPPKVGGPQQTATGILAAMSGQAAVPPSCAPPLGGGLSSASSLLAGLGSMRSPTMTSMGAARRLVVAIGSEHRLGKPYIDVTKLPGLEEVNNMTIGPARNRGGVTESFPEKLHRMIKEADKTQDSEIISFLPHGRAFAVRHVKKFVETILPKYFKQSKWTSFSRQLSLYGFQRVASGPDAGSYYHELFLRDRPRLCTYMRRVGVTRPPQPQLLFEESRDERRIKLKAARNNGDQEAQPPDFYAMHLQSAASS